MKAEDAQDIRAAIAEVPFENADMIASAVGAFCLTRALFPQGVGFSGAVHFMPPTL